jgi:hypothetical protein
MRAIAEMLTAYHQQKELINDLQARLIRIQLDSEEAVKQADELKAQLRGLQLVNAGLQRDEKLLQGAIDEQRRIQEAEIARLKKSRWKWLLSGVAGGVIIGIVVGLSGGQ